MIRFGVFGLLTAALLIADAEVAAAAEFRIESLVYAGEEEEPASKTTTLFQDDVVYDFLEDEGRVAIFRMAASATTGRFILLDLERKVRTEMSTESLTQFSTALKAWSASQEDPLLKFCSNPDFTEHWNPTSSQLTLEAPELRYHVMADPMPTREAALQYREFTDWYSRLGAFLQPGMLPPFARLRLNEALSKYQLMPREVHLTLAAHKPYRKEPIDMRSEHQVFWRLSKEDQDRIDDAGEQLVEFKLVTPAEYRKGL